jgi:acyl carrier protein
MSKLSESQKVEIKDLLSDKSGLNVEKVFDDSKLEDDLDLDSLDLVEIVMELEKMFDITIPDDDYRQGMVVADLYEIVERYNR